MDGTGVEKGGDQFRVADVAELVAARDPLDDRRPDGGDAEEPQRRTAHHDPTESLHTGVERVARHRRAHRSTASTSCSTNASNSWRPSSAVAWAGSPSTPDGLMATTPRCTSSAIDGTGPAVARSERTCSGASASI